MKQTILAVFLLLGIISLAPNSYSDSRDDSKYEVATLAGGCFWGMEHLLRSFPGVIETDVGYTGGFLPDPNYRTADIGGHAEAVEVKFDKTKTSYKKILNFFFKIHDPTTLNRQGNDIGPQYRSAIFYYSEEQEKVAKDFIKKVEKSRAWGYTIATQLVKATTFYKAENYHQDFLIKNPHGYNHHYVRNISFD